MKCRFKKNLLSAPAFSLIETVTALIILALISSSVLVVINRCMASAVDSELRMQAFEVARDNMETLLSKDAVEEMMEYGSSDRYPEIRWQTTVEMFYEPAVMEQTQLWVKGICSAEYTDSAGELKTIELTHWLTGLTKEQILQLEQERLSEPNEPFEPNEPSEPNSQQPQPEPEPEQDRSPESNRDCDSLSFCESVKCHLEAGTSGRPTNEEFIRFINECP